MGLWETALRVGRDISSVMSVALAAAHVPLLVESVSMPMLSRQTRRQNQFSEPPRLLSHLLGRGPEGS